MAYLTPQVENDPLHSLIMLLGKELNFWISYSLFNELYTRAEEPVPWRCPN